jgi:hypothetical protein
LLIDDGGFLIANHEAITRGTIGVSHVQYFEVWYFNPLQTANGIIFKGKIT